MSNLTHIEESNRRPSEDRLYDVAEAQSGYFTTAQARGAGYSTPLLRHHVRAGRFAHVRRGIYRLSRFPASPNEDLVVAWLAAGPRAAVSHESALALYGLSDALPGAVHVTVPRTASRRRSGFKLHTGELADEDVTRRDGMRVTTVARTIVDLTARGLSDELLDQAVRQALGRGLVSSTVLEDHARRRSARVAKRIALILRHAGSPAARRS